MTPRLVAIFELAAASALAPLAVWITAFGYPDPGLVVSEGEARVVSVFPGGPSWSDGLRPGQTLVALESGLDATRWRVLARDGELLAATSYLRQEGVLRGAASLALTAAALTGTALFAVRRLAVASALAAFGVVLAALAIYPSGAPVLTTGATVVALLAPTAWLLAWHARSRVVAVAVVGATLSVTTAWVAARHVVPAFFDGVDAARQATLAGVSLSVLVLLGDWRRWGRRLTLVPRTWADAAAAGVIIALSAFVVVALELPVLAMVGLLVPSLLLYPRFRAVIASVADRVVLGDVRDRARIQAVEEERSRIARDIHDAPLQEVAAVIRQLDGMPGTDREIELLRNVAGHLRSMTTELRPPILDDLGLFAAIAYVADQASVNAPGVDVQLWLLPDEPQLDRPPASVELALFRIVQESVDNAVRHAEASTIKIQASITSRQVDVSVTDDGKGISDAAARQAAREGHFGLASMSQRAALIGAQLRVEATRPHGTRVAVHWDVDR